jgi:hypothetical protein
MALVRKFERAETQAPKVHQAVDCTFSVFDGPDGRRYFQINTSGTSTRKLKGRQSQTMQFDTESLTALVAILRTEFPSL